MKYKSQHSNLVLYAPNGNAVYKFKQGSLTVGTATGTTGTNIIDYTSIMSLYATDLLGATTHAIEMAGQGTLNGLDDDGTAVTPLSKGYRGGFFKTPPIAAGQSVPAVASIYYIVTSGIVTYNGVAYYPGDIFVTNGTETTTSATSAGYFELTIPPALDHECEAFRSCQFEINTLQRGDESSAYWNWDDSGFEPQDSLYTTNADWVGYVRGSGGR
jgi:hypothetical protein